MAKIALKKVVKSYGKTRVVHAIDLDIEHNEFVVLVGPSGCGKSTTLRMIAGLEDISDGEIYIGDRLVNNLPPRKRNISMVFQNYALYPHMNVRENLGFGLKISKKSKEDIESQTMEAAKILGLTDLLDRVPAELSGGQRQRVAMGRAIVRHPEVFLFDEPLSNLDAKLRVQMRAEIKKLHASVKTTVVYVTHDQVEAMTLADRIVVMKDGYIEQAGTPMDVFRNPVNTFVAGFIGSPPMNLIPARINKKEICLTDGTKIPLPKSFIQKVQDGQQVILGIRPDDISPVGYSMFHGKKAQATLTLNVTISELLGTESIIYSMLAGQEIQSKMFNPSEQLIAHGTAMDFELALDNLHMFDAASTLSLKADTQQHTKKESL